MASPAKGTILEVKETKGLGTTLDVIIYDGIIHVGDTIVVGAREPIVTKVKALLRPRSLDEMRDPRKPFKSVHQVYAASGVKIVAPNIETAMPGAPVYVGGSELVEKIKQEIGEVEFDKDVSGLIIKADTLGSLEAMVKILAGEDIPVKRGSIGKVNKEDVTAAASLAKENKYFGVVLAFNAPLLDDARILADDSGVKIISSNIIYSLLDDYKLWVKESRESDKKELAKRITTPAKFQILKDHTFRQSKPAIVGVEILAGTLRSGARLMGVSGKVEGKIRGMQSSGENIEEAKKGMKVAVSMDDVVIGRHYDEGDVVYTFIDIEDAKQLNPDDLSDDEKQVLREIKEVKKKRM